MSRSIKQIVAQYKEDKSKKFGGQLRAQAARDAMSDIFSNPEHDLYLEKDIDLARRFSVSRLTIYNIREELHIPPRTDRILLKLKDLDTKRYTKKELAEMLNMKYQNLYKIIREYKIKVKPDIRPIESMIKFQREKIKKEAPKKKSIRGSKKVKQESQ